MAKEKLPELPRWDGPLSHPFYSKVVKRILDFVLAVILLIPQERDGRWGMRGRRLL